MVLDPEKLLVQHQIKKNTVQDKKRLSIPRLDAKHIFHKKRLSCSKTQVLTQNGVTQENSPFNTQ